MIGWRLSTVLALASSVLPAEEAARRPLPVAFEETTTYRWLRKPVLESRLLDDMESTANWVLRGKGEMTLSAERARDGGQSLRLRTRAKDEAGKMGRAWGAASVTRKIPGEDWTHFNRISFWVYPDLPGFHTVAMLVLLQNEGKEKVPATWGREGLNYINVQNRRWNHVVWEIPNLARDKVTGVVLQYTKNGHEPEAEGTVALDFDHLTLERIEADHFEGWNVAPGRISFSHSGYQPGLRKTALASGVKATEFQLIRQDTGEALLTKPVRQVKSPIGGFQELDFSEVRQPGVYTLRAGDAETRPFRIGADSWRNSILKGLNFYYVERCGKEMPGSHRVCHRDWQAVHGEQKIIINGGWHDAGDLTQHIMNTGESTYALFALAERLRAGAQDPELCAFVLEEAKWGLDWVLKTSFGDGFRAAFSAQAYWTDGVVGTADDVVAEARNMPYENFVAAAAEAIAARVLRDSEPALAAHSLKMARDDWRFAVEGMSQEHSRGSLGGRIEVLSTGILASIDLLRFTGDEQYGSRALAMGEELLQSQQRSFLPGLTTPITGFFYTGPSKERILHYEHPGHEQGPMVALAALCDAFPNHRDWMRWYSAVVLHTDYYMKRMAAYTEPYRMLPAGVFREDDHLHAREAYRDSYRRQVLNGIEIGKGHRLRLFPVWFERRGNAGTGLSQTKAVSAAAHLRGDLALASLAQDQLQWLVGRNPFVQSLMYGEGYDYPPQYTVMSGDMAGALPVGIQTRGDSDVPYWPAANCYNYKEVWVQPVARWMYIMADLHGPAVVTGRVAADGKPVLFRDAAAVYEADPDPASGIFRAVLPGGRYTVSHAGNSERIVVLPGATNALDLAHALDLNAAKETRSGGHVTLRVTAEGSGRHRLSVRANNLTFSEPPDRHVTLTPGAAQTLVWRGKVSREDTPWVAVIIPNGDVAQKQELTGSERDH